MSVDNKVRQLWLTPQQIDLAIVALNFLSKEISGGIASNAHIAAATFTQRRLSELLEILEACAAQAPK